MDDGNRMRLDSEEPVESEFSYTENHGRNCSGDKIILKMNENSEATIRRALSSYDLGRKLRQLRLRKKIALVDLGKHTGLSASMLSQLENGKLIPTLPTLARIAMVFDVGLDYFFTDKKRKRTFALVQAEDRMKFPDRPGSPKPNYFFECLAFSAPEKGIQAFLAEFPKRNWDEVPEHFHEGSELVHVLEGTLEIRYQGEEHALKQGDSVFFDGFEPHGYRGTSKLPARALVITSPPRL
jgi:transcriptional regulator with XRE-family HTH domain